MTVDEVKAFLERTGLPVAYEEFQGLKAPPYITFKEAYSADFYADDQNYAPIANYDVDLFTAKKDPASEELLEGLFKATDTTYTKTEATLEQDHLRQVTYTISTVGG
jgi:hypothetical protein